MSEKQNKKDQFPPSSNRMSEGARSAQFRIVTHRQGQEPATFYIQSKGLHAGRTMTAPTANCWAVYTNIAHLKSIALSIYLSRYLRTSIIGSVVPFIRLSDYKPILLRAVDRAEYYDPKHLKTLDFLQDQIGSFETKIELFKAFQSSLALKINHELQIFQ